MITAYFDEEQVYPYIPGGSINLYDSLAFVKEKKKLPTLRPAFDIISRGKKEVSSRVFIAARFVAEERPLTAQIPFSRRNR